MGIEITVNEKVESTDAASDTPLLYVLRDDLELRGPKFGCGLSQCGACAVLVDGKETRSCVTPVAAVVGKQVTTLEGLPALYAKQKQLATPPALHPLQQAWIDEQVPQCGYCQSGMIIMAADLLARNARPDRRGDQEVDGSASLSAARPTTRSCAQSSVPPKQRPEPVRSLDMTSLEHQKFTRSALPERGRRSDRRDRLPAGRLAPAAQ